MKTVHRKTMAAAGLAALAIFGAAACSNDSSSEASTTSASVMETTIEAAPPAAMADPAANLVGAGCAGYAEQVPSGPGSVAGMSQDPVTVAARTIRY